VFRGVFRVNVRTLAEVLSACCAGQHAGVAGAMPRCAFEYAVAAVQVSSNSDSFSPQVEPARAI